jgi:hypothetical protein
MKCSLRGSLSELWINWGNQMRIKKSKTIKNKLRTKCGWGATIRVGILLARVNVSVILCDM